MLVSTKNLCGDKSAAKKLMDLGIVPLCLSILKHDLPTTAHALTLEALLQLSFTQDLPNKSDIRKAVTQLTSTDATLLAQGNLLLERMEKPKKGGKTLRGKKSTKRKAAAADDTKQGHVMISYQWDHQKEILSLAQFLKDHGVSVWYDINEEEGKGMGSK